MQDLSRADEQIQINAEAKVLSFLQESCSLVPSHRLGTIQVSALFQIPTVIILLSLRICEQFTVYKGVIFMSKETFIKPLVLRKYVWFALFCFCKRGLLFIKRAACAMGEGKIQKRFFCSSTFSWFSVRLRTLHMDGLHRVLKLPEIMWIILCLRGAFCPWGEEYSINIYINYSILKKSQIYELGVHFIKWLGTILFNELSSTFEIIPFTCHFSETRVICSTPTTLGILHFVVQ